MDKEKLQQIKRLTGFKFEGHSKKHNAYTFKNDELGLFVDFYLDTKDVYISSYYQDYVKCNAVFITNLNCICKEILGW